ncbi:MAG TPA: NAD-dependent epimerase/dehydratase family protein [Planctomycetota bacterium]|jgi:CDP-paratose 2-epimerase
MSVAIVTGSAGLIGSESSRFLHAKGFDIVGIDNDMRRVFFGDDASTKWSRRELETELPRYKHFAIDIRNQPAIEKVFAKYGSDIKIVVHAAAQPSHDWAASDPVTDFSVNAGGTLAMLEATRKHAPDAVFIFTSTNKVYGDNPNSLPLIEQESRWEIDPEHPYSNGIDETMSLDQTKHSVFGASKVAADVMVQEYGRYFGMKTGVFRGGCLTGPNHSGTRLHGFLAYLVKCAVTGETYTIFGYKGKQVRDNIHSHDLTNMFWNFYKKPRPGAVYNAGGGRHSNCSVREAIDICQELSGRKMSIQYSETNRIGDHIWWVSSVARFQHDYPDWQYKYGLDEIMREIYGAMSERFGAVRSPALPRGRAVRSEGASARRSGAHPRR